jgi:hypothetical protein
MNTEIVTALIAIVSGGGLTAFLNTVFARQREKLELRDKDVDQRITVWQTLSEKNEARMNLAEQRLEYCDCNMKNLERYISSLEQIILRNDSSMQLPERPEIQTLKFEKRKGGED